MIGGEVLSRCRLYGIVDLGYVDISRAPRVAAEMISGGVDVIQLRGKTHDLAELAGLAEDIRKITQPAGVQLVINDHPAIARQVGADGVHVGQDDISVAEARAIAGPNCFVGKSTHSVEQAERAAAEGADYIGFGPIFATPTKPDYRPIGLQDIARVHELMRLPVFCIGGLKLHNIPEIVAAGAQRVVIVSEMLQAADVSDYARRAKALLPHSNNQ